MGPGGQGIRFGRKTGATLRRPHGGRRNNSNHSICKKEKNIKEDYGVISEKFSEQFDDGDLCSHQKQYVFDNGVQYSLNKHKRWTIPGILKDDILMNPQHDENTFQVRLIERQLIGDSTRKGDCIAVHTSKGRKRCRKPRKTFSHAENLIDDLSSLDQSRSCGRRKERASVELLSDPVPEVCYVVSYTRPVDSFPHFNPSKDFKSKVKSKHSRVRNRRRVEDLQNMDDGVWDEMEGIDMEEECANNPSLSTPNLGQFIITKQQQINSENSNIDVRSFPNRASSQSWVNFGKDAKVVVEKKPRLEKKAKKQKQTKRNKVDDDIEENDCLNIPNICINVCRKSCTSENLCEQFGNSYAEGESLPRRFKVNISLFLRDCLKASGQFNLVRKMEFLGHECCVIFVTDGADLDKNNEFIKMRLSLFGIKNLNSCVYLDNFESSLRNSRVYTVLEVVNTIKRVFQIIPPKLFDVGSVCFKLKPGIALDNLSSALNVNVDILTPHLALKSRKAVQEPQVVEPKKILTGTHNNICGICDDDLLLFNTLSMALRCQHWFCKDCWLLHIESRIQRGDGQILCPAYDCEFPVDNTSLMSLISADQFFRHNLHAQNRHIESSPEWHWCPRPLCGRVAWIRGCSDGNAFLCCDCGLQSCLQCKAEAHWPATCQQFEDYQNSMKKIGEEKKSLITRVKVKRCPACWQPMEKNGGCPVMTCRCGCQFCWNCLSTNGYGCTCSHKDIYKRFEYVKLEVPIVTEVGLLEQALNHHLTIKGVHKRRQLQNKAYTVITKMFVKSISSSNFLPTKKILSTCEQSKLQELLALTCKALQFYFESKKIMEYSCVLMSYSKCDLSRETLCQITRLENIVQLLEEILKGGLSTQNYTIEATESILQTCLTSGCTYIKLLANSVTQRASGEAN